MSDRPRDEDVPQPEPPERPEEPIVAEPRESDPVEPVRIDQGSGQPIAPDQIAPDPGAAPVAAEPPTPQALPEPEPENRGPDMVAPEEAPKAEPGGEAPGPAPVASVYGDPGHGEAAPGGPAPAEPAHTEDTLALPPTTSIDPQPSSQPERMPALEGIAVPFAAPPAERNSGKFAATLAVGIVGGVAIVIAVVVALVVSLVTLTESLMDKIEDTATAFMDDIADEQWDDAYARLCPSMQHRPVEDYIDDWEAWDADGADVKPVRDEMSGTYVPVELGDGSTVELKIYIDQGSEAVDTAVCGWDHKD